MVEVNFTLLIQAVNFLLILWFLNVFVFKPVLKHIDEREAKIKGITDDADDMTRRSEEAMAKYEEELIQVRHDASEIITTARQEALDKQSAVLDGARAEFKGMLDKSKKEINGEVEAATKSLNENLDGFSKSLAGKILGRNV